jgi:hypothetical protein
MGEGSVEGMGKTPDENEVELQILGGPKGSL